MYEYQLRTLNFVIEMTGAHGGAYDVVLGIVFCCFGCGAVHNQLPATLFRQNVETVSSNRQRNTLNGNARIQKQSHGLIAWRPDMSLIDLVWLPRVLKAHAVTILESAGDFLQLIRTRPCETAACKDHNQNCQNASREIMHCFQPRLKGCAWSRAGTRISEMVQLLGRKASVMRLF